MINFFLRVLAFLLARDKRAIMPPSPLLLARIIKVIYFIETISAKDQNIRVSIPRTFLLFNARMLLPILKIILIA